MLGNGAFNHLHVAVHRHFLSSSCKNRLIHTSSSHLRSRSNGQFVWTTNHFNHQLGQSRFPHLHPSSVYLRGKSTSTSKDAISTEHRLPIQQRAWKAVKEGATHYWHGTKLLVSEVRISARLQAKLLKGGTLTRREKRQLKRTTQDLLRLLPFSVFVIVPFMEFLLPVAVRLFPNMLPSTFEDKYAAEEKQRKLLRVRLEMAKFLQETIKESGLKANARIVGSQEFKEFFRKVRSTGETPSSTDIIDVARLFDDDLTLDNLSRPQLHSMCRYMNLNAFGTDNFLRGTIRGRLTQLRRDDLQIDNEGVQSLSTSELQNACQSRGIRTPGMSPARLRNELSAWISLHLYKRVSGVLLILSRAFLFDRQIQDKEDEQSIIVNSLGAVLSGLPDNLLNEAELEVESDTATYKKKLDVLHEQEELIEDEKEQEEKEESVRRERREAEEQARQEEEERTAQSLLPDSELEDSSDDHHRMTTEQLRELGEALSILSAKSSVLKERDALRLLMGENTQSEEDPETAGNPLVKRIRTMLHKIDEQLQEYDSRVGSSLQMISCDSQGRISVRDLEHGLAVIRHKPDDEVGQAVIRKLDVDQDGYVVLDHVLDLVKSEGLGVVLDSDAQRILGQGMDIKNSRPKREDILQDQ